MNTIGINHNLDRQRIRKLLLIGLLAMLPNQERFDAFKKRLMEGEAI